MVGEKRFLVERVFDLGGLMSKVSESLEVGRSVRGSNGGFGML